VNETDLSGKMYLTGSRRGEAASAAEAALAGEAVKHTAGKWYDDYVPDKPENIARDAEGTGSFFAGAAGQLFIDGTSGHHYDGAALAGRAVTAGAVSSVGFDAGAFAGGFGGPLDVFTIPAGGFIGSTIAVHFAKPVIDWAGHAADSVWHAVDPF
jgi:hypothetical protein